MAMRVLGGSARGKKLLGPTGLDFRPTTSRVKEFLFEILGDRVIDASVLDLFSGTGSLGIECLSRGARSITFVEQSKPHLRILKQNLINCGFSGKGRTQLGDVFQTLPKFRKRGLTFDLILADPPFKESLKGRIIHSVAENRILTNDGYLIIEHDRHDQTDNQLLTLKRERRFGDCVISIYSKEKES